jgi:hypothetical protein
MHLVEGIVRGPEVYYNMQTGTPRTGHWFWTEVADGNEKIRVNFCVDILTYDELRRRSSNVDETIKERVSGFVRDQLSRGWAPENNTEILLREIDLGIDFTKAG